MCKSKPYYLIEYRSDYVSPLITRFETKKYAQIAYDKSRFVKFLVHEESFLPSACVYFNPLNPVL